MFALCSRSQGLLAMAPAVTHKWRLCPKDGVSPVTAMLSLYAVILREPESVSVPWEMASAKGSQAVECGVVFKSEILNPGRASV